MDNQNKNKKIHIMLVVLSILTPVLVLGLAIGLITAWYTNVIQTGDINASTKNVSIIYTINDRTEENETTYSITNLAFFDADSEKEGKYLEDMSCKIRLNITNNSSDSVKYTIRFESDKFTSPSTGTVTSRAYAACVFDDVTKDTSNHKTVNSYLVNSETQTAEITYYKEAETNTKYVAEKKVLTILPSNGSSYVDLYVFGIQDLDGAKSEDFLYTNIQKTSTRSYQFRLSIIAEPQGSPIITENTTTTTTTTS